MKKGYIAIGVIAYMGIMAMLYPLRSGTGTPLAVTVEKSFTAYPNAQDLIDHAAYIFTGTIEEGIADIVTDGDKFKEALTVYDVQLRQSYKGSPKSPLQVEVYGVQVEQTTYQYETASQPQRGKEYLFFTDENYRLLNPMQCCYEIQLKDAKSIYEGYEITLQELLAACEDLSN